MTTKRLPLVVEDGQIRQMARTDSIDENVVVENDDGRLALSLVRQLILELTEAGIDLSDTLTNQIALIEGT